MQGIALFLFALTFPSVLTELELDVNEIDVKGFQLPIRIDADRLPEMKTVGIFVSTDKGKQWKHFKDFDPTIQGFAFHAPDDGIYWFAVQVESKEGLKEPSSMKDLKPAMKIWVNSERKSLKPNDSTPEPQKELEKLRKTVQEQKKAIAELESAVRKKDMSAPLVSIKIEIHFK